MISGCSRRISKVACMNSGSWLRHMQADLRFAQAATAVGAEGVEQWQGGLKHCPGGSVLQVALLLHAVGLMWRGELQIKLGPQAHGNADLHAAQAVILGCALLVDGCAVELAIEIRAQFSLLWVGQPLAFGARQVGAANLQDAGLGGVAAFTVAAAAEQ